MDRLESLAVQSSAKSQVSPMLQATAGASHFHHGCQSTAPSSSAAGLTLPDGRFNVGTHLPLLAKRYKYLSTLGEGVSAQVLLVEDTFRPGHLVTIKVMKRQHKNTGYREVRALRFLHSRLPSGTPAPGIVRLVDTFTLGAHFCLVLDRLHPRLLDWVAESAALPSPTASLPDLMKIAYQLLTTVAFLHSHGVVHADIKPDNILLREPAGSPSVALALVDLGGAFSTTETDMNTLLAEVQTLPYRAPEIALGLLCGAAVDEWSIGVVLAEAALKRPLFPCTSPMDLVQAMAAQLGPLPAEVVAASTLGQNYDLSSLVMPPPPGNNSNSNAVPHGTLFDILGHDAAVYTAATCLSSLHAAVPQALRQLDPLFADLVMGLLHYNPAKRLQAKQALVHPFFSKLSSLPTIFPELVVASGLLVKNLKAATTHPSATIPVVETQQKRAAQATTAVLPTAATKRPPAAAAAAAVHDSSELAASVVFGDAVESAGQQQHAVRNPQDRQTESESGSGAMAKTGTDSAAKRARRERGSGRSAGAGSAPAPEVRSRTSKPWWVV
jgi:serine/threonine protein kinase